jgi:hypothetical protein
MIDRRLGDSGSPSRHAARALMLGLVLPVLLGGPFVSRAQEEQANSGLGGFSGFVEAAPHVVVQRARGSVDTNFNVSSRKSNIVTNMTFRLGGGIKGPAFDSIWGRPRLVVYAAALVPINESSTIGTQFVETSLPQSGLETIEFSKFAVEYQTSALAGLGLEFTIPVFDSEITVSPAIDSLHLVTRYTGNASLQRNATGLSEFREARGKEEITQHFLGPALRLGTPTIVIKGIAIDFFLDVSLLVDVAGTRKQFTVSGDDGDRGTFTFEAGSGVAQVGSGFQIRWP